MKTMYKAICVFTLVFFVMSMTGAAVAVEGHHKSPTAVDDRFVYHGNKPKYNNVLNNDIGRDLKVQSVGVIKTTNGGKVRMYSDGYFIILKKPCGNCASFTYTVREDNKWGKTDTGCVKLIFC